MYVGNETDKTVTIGITYGPISFTVIEEWEHARSLWHNLGEALDRHDKAMKAKEENA